MKKGDIESAVKIIELNYDKKEAVEIGNEIKTMFMDLPVKPSYIVAVDEKNNELLGYGGFIQSMMSYGIYEMFSINVHPKHQGKGIGTEISTNLIKKIKLLEGENKKAYRITLTCKQRLKNFYSKFGFRSIEDFDKKRDNLMILDLE